MNKPELLSPAGTLRNMRYAFAYGADAVYAGMPRYSLRVRNNDFLYENLATGIAEAHQQGKQFFVAANVLPHDRKLSTFLEDIAPIIELKPDALIMADPGLILLVREHYSQMPIHLSVQANTMNAQAVRFWQNIGLSRIILSRELSLDEIDFIRQSCPDIELEVFVHGALCIAYSGRCLLSGYFNHRDANQGTCTNACRWDYQLKQPAIGGYYIEESNRPGEYMPIEEDEHGTYIMNSKDLRAVEHVQRLVAIGVDCLKIEGRTKSHYYTARVTQVYRRAIDDALAGRPFDPQLMVDLEALSNRGYTDGFLQRHAPQELQNYRYGASQAEQEQFVAEVLDYQDGQALVAVKNKFSCGDQLLLIQPTGRHRFCLQNMYDEQGQALQTAPGSGWRVWISVPEPADSFALITKIYD